MTARRPEPSPARAFTLLEVLLAVAIFAIVLAAINTVFYSALRLERRTSSLLDEAQPLHQALAFLRRDLQGALPPGGLLAAGFKIGAVGTGIGVAQAAGIQFCTASGIINDRGSWGDIQEVTYQLADPEDGAGAAGKDLVRSITRNVLSTTQQTPEEQRLLRNVESVEYTGYDGSNWRDTWDTTAGDTNLPSAIRVRIQLATTNAVDTRNREPLQLLVLLDSQSRTNQSDTNAQAGATGGTQ